MTYKGPKGKAWKMFSLYIRLRDCLETTGSPDFFICPTCGLKFPASEGQAGHSIAGRGNSILLHEEIVHCQCRGCNMTGQYHLYSLFMIKTYGLDHWEYLCRLKKLPKPIKPHEWEEKVGIYKMKYEGLLEIC